MYDVLGHRTCRSRTSSARDAVANLDVAPSRISLAKLETQLVGEIDGHFRLKDRLAALERATTSS